MKIINVHEHHAYDKNNAEYVNAGTFHNKPGVIVSSENVWTNKYVQMQYILHIISYNKTT